MANFNFTMPVVRGELAEECKIKYIVRNVIAPSKIISKLSDARSAFRDQGVTFIIANFDTYFSVLHHIDTLRFDVIDKAYKDLFTAVERLSFYLGFLLNDKDSLTDRLKAETVTVTKMLTYIYIQFVTCMEQKRLHAQEEPVGQKRSKRKRKSVDFSVDKRKVFEALNGIICKDIATFWKPSTVEQDFITSIAELCHFFLQHPSIQQERETRDDIFGVFGTLIKSYGYRNRFAARLVHSIRMYEHVAQCAAEGIQLVVQEFGCRQLIRNCIMWATECPEDETPQDEQGTRSCAAFIAELARLMPNLMIPQVKSLNKYLAYDSKPLRMTILNVITEVLIKVLTKDELSNQEDELRAELLDDMIKHIEDVAMEFRVMVIQSLCRLQKEKALPSDYQIQVLRKMVELLSDETEATRKAAIGCITSFVKYNSLNGNLQLKQTEMELLKKKNLVKLIQTFYEEEQTSKVLTVLTDWCKMKNEVERTIREQLEMDEEEEEDDEDEPDMERNEVVELLRSELKNKQYVEAFKLCRFIKDEIDEWKNMKNISRDEEVKLYLVILRSTFVNIDKISEECAAKVKIPDEDKERIKSLQKIINDLNDKVAFLSIIKSVIEPMKRMIFTGTIGDLHEACKFFTTAYQIQIENASVGIREMLKVVRANIEERKDTIMEVLQTMCFATNTEDIIDHKTTVVNRFIRMLKHLPSDSYKDFQCAISEWTLKGVFDNDMIDLCWQYYTRRAPVSEGEARAVAILLKMAAMGRQSIISENIELVTTVAFSDKNMNNLLFLAVSCRLLAIAGAKQTDTQDEDPSWKLNPETQAFQRLASVLYKQFFAPTSEYYIEAVEAGLHCTFRVCSDPIEVCEKILKQVHQQLIREDQLIDMAMLTRLCRLLAFTALQLLSYLKKAVNKELNRTNSVQETRNQNNENKATTSTNETVANEGDLTEEIDYDSELVTRVLQNSILSKMDSLNYYVDFMRRVIDESYDYDNGNVQDGAVLTLIRFMMMCGTVCRRHVPLLFTAFDRKKYPVVTCTILTQYNGLLTRFPDVFESWVPKIYGKLRDPSVSVRKTALDALTRLIYENKIPAQAHVWDIAVCLTDECQEIREMSKSYFRKLAKKEDILVNVLPDIFSQLILRNTIEEENVRNIMRFLFTFVNDSKNAEYFVHRFCHQYSVSGEMKINRNVTFCLSLINYNDKALKKLHEMLPMYSCHLHVTEIHSIFMQILTKCGNQAAGKVNLKPIISDIEASMASIFKVHEGDQLVKMESVEEPVNFVENVKVEVVESAITISSDSDDS